MQALMLAAWVQSKFCCSGSCEDLAAEFDQGSVQNPATSLTKALHHLLPILLFCVFSLPLPSRPIANPEQKMYLGNLSAAHLPAAQINHSALKFSGACDWDSQTSTAAQAGLVSPGSWWTFAGGAKEELCFPCVLSWPPEADIHGEAAHCSSVELPMPLGFDAFVQQNPGKVLWWREPVKKILLKKNYHLTISLRGRNIVLWVDISLQERKKE